MEQITFNPGADVTTDNVDATTVDATTVNATTVTASGTATAGAFSTAGSVTAASVSASGNISANTLTVTGLGALGSADVTGTLTAADVDTPELRVDTLRIPRALNTITITSPIPVASVDYALPDIKANGTIAIYTQMMYTADITNTAGTIVYYPNQSFTLTRQGTVVTVSINANGPFDGMGEPQLQTDPANLMPVRYRSTTARFYPIYVRSGGLDGVGFLLVGLSGAITFYGRDGGAWDGADCRIYPTTITYNGGVL